jgi:ketosteroid isomerase-like protein
MRWECFVTDNIEVVRKMYTDLARGDFEALTAVLDPEVEWAEPDLEYLPYAGLTVGRDNVVNSVYAKIPSVYEKVEFVPDKLIDGGDTVTVVGRATMKGPYGEQVQFPFAHVIRLCNGLVARFDHFVDTHKIAKTLNCNSAPA